MLGSWGRSPQTIFSFFTLLSFTVQQIKGSSLWAQKRSPLSLQEGPNMSLFEYSNSLNLAKHEPMPAWPVAPSSVLEERLMSLGTRWGPREGSGQVSGEDVACPVSRSLVAPGSSPSPWGEPGWRRAPVAWTERTALVPQKEAGLGSPVSGTPQKRQSPVSGLAQFRGRCLVPSLPFAGCSPLSSSLSSNKAPWYTHPLSVMSGFLP